MVAAENKRMWENAPRRVHRSVWVTYDGAAWSGRRTTC